MYKNIKPSLVFIVYQANNDEIIVVDNSNDNSNIQVFSLPGGEINENESPHNAINRLLYSQTKEFCDISACSKPYHQAMIDGKLAWWFVEEKNIKISKARAPNFVTLPLKDIAELDQNNQWLLNLDKKILNGKSINQKYFNAVRDVFYDKATIFSLRHFVRQKADVNYTSNFNGDSPLVMAARFGKLELLEFLLRHGADVNQPAYRPSEFLSPLMEAIIGGSSECVNKLLDFKANVNQVDALGSNALHYVFSSHAKQIDLKIICALVENGIDINHQNYGGYTPLMWSLNNKSKNIVQAVKLLLDMGADSQIKKNDGESIYDIEIDDDVKESAERVMSVIHSFDEKQTLDHFVDQESDQPVVLKF